MKKQNYSFGIGLLKTAKNSAVLLVPFLLALLAGFPSKFAWVAGPIAYLLKNWADNR